MFLRIRSYIFWVTATCRPLKVNRRYWRTCHFDFQGRIIKPSWSCAHCLLYAGFLPDMLPQPWSWKRYSPPKRQLIFTRLHGITFQKIEFLSQMNPNETYSNSILPFTFRFSKSFFQFVSSDQNFQEYFYRSHVCYMTCPSHLPWFNHSTNIQWKVQNMEPLVIQFFHASDTLPPPTPTLTSKYCLHYLVLKGNILKICALRITYWLSCLMLSRFVIVYLQFPHCIRFAK
jgi:hypothetical protein